MTDKIKAEEKEEVSSSSSWTVTDSYLKKLLKDEVLKKESEEIFSEKQSELSLLLDQAQKFYSEGKLSASAKKIRQLARVIKDIQFSVEQKGNFHKKNTLNDLSGKEWLRHTKSWFIADGRPSDFDKAIENHPGSFPPSVAKYFIEFFTKKGDWVIDPFMGIGSTLQACKDLQRNCWGTELNPVYVNYTNERVKGSSDLLLNVIQADARKMKTLSKKHNLPKAKLLITSPPYWNILETSRGGVESSLKKRAKKGLDQTYSDQENDIGNLVEYDRYLQELCSILTKCSDLMENKAYFVIVLQNIRPKSGVMKPIAWDVAKNLAQVQGIDLKQEFIWLQDQKFMGIWGYPSQYVSNVHHHYCLVFQKNEEEKR